VWVAAATPAAGFEVESDSDGNRLYVVVWNRDTEGSLTGVQVNVTGTPFTTTPSPVSVPASVPPDASRLAGFDFDVLPSALVGATGSLQVVVTGTVQGEARVSTQLVPLQVVANAQGLQGPVGSGTGVPGIVTLNADGDAFADQHEIRVGSDPFDALSHPSVQVPSGAPAALAALAAALLVTGLHRISRARRGSLAGT
jgi:hypothetical protein